MSKTLIIYYSMQGNTKRVANIIKDKLNADILELKLKVNYNLATSLTLGAMHIKQKHCPKLKPYEIDLSKYSEIYIGTPVWWYSFAPPLRTFIEDNSIEAKKIKLFSTHQGANGKTFSDLKECIGVEKVIAAKDFNHSSKSRWEIEVDNFINNKQ